MPARLRPPTRPSPYQGLLLQVQAAKRAKEAEAARQLVAERGDEIRAKCKTLVGFMRHFWHVLEPGTRYVHNWHIDAIADHLEAIARGDLQNLAINIPPGHMKSLLVSVFFPAWWWTLDASKRFLSGSYEQALALRDNEKMRALVTDPQYEELWGESTRLIKTGTSSFMNKKRGTRDARAYASMTGGRGDVVLIDDPHSLDSAESDQQRGKTVRLFVESIQNRTNDAATSAIIVIMQRLHAQDICGAIDSLGLDYERLVLPMEFERARRCTTKIGFKDPRTYEGQLLFPEKFPPEKLKTFKKMGSYAYAGQYQQRPVPREGGLFKREWFAGKIVPAAPKGTVWWRHWDLADTDLTVQDTTGARTAGVKMGRGPDGEIYVGHMVAIGASGAKVKKLIKGTAEIDGKAVKISIPQDPGASGKIVYRDMATFLAGWTVQRLLESKLGDKVARAEPFATQCEVGNVYLLEGAWNEEFLDELCMFPGGQRKDIADACSGAFSRLIEPPKKKKLAKPRFIGG